PTPARSRISTVPCSSTPARMRPNTYSGVRRSRMTASMPAWCKSWPSSSPAGPAPMIATCVRTPPPRKHGQRCRAGPAGTMEKRHDLLDISQPAELTRASMVMGTWERNVARREIPQYFLYGEATHDVDEHFLHVESIAERSRLHDWKIRPHAHQDLHHFLL